jgi:uncharacterized protein (TIGR03435 family)
MAEFLVRRLGFCKAYLLHAVVVVTCLTAVTAWSATLESQIAPGARVAPEQTSSLEPWEAMAGGKMAFDVASVKQDKSEAKPRSNVKLDNTRTAYPPNGGVFIAKNWQLATYIAFAYKLSAQQNYVMAKSLPDWAYTDRFDIEAKSDNHSPTKDQMRLMLQALLEDRFKLVGQMETRQLPAFGLVLAKPGKTGPQLKQHSVDSPCPATNSVSSAASAPVETILRTWPPNCGHIRFSEIPGGYRLAGRNLSMGELADSLIYGIEDRVVVDQTGLTGTFDFVMDFAAESDADANGSKVRAESSLPTFRESVADQLGLKLVKKTAPMDCFVVVHVEYPSAN